MKKYFVNVHYDVCVSVIVEADCDDAALDMAENMTDYALNIDVDDDLDFHVDFAESCIVNEEDIDEGNEM